jgi:hypothetical protein
MASEAAQQEYRAARVEWAKVFAEFAWNQQAIGVELNEDWLRTASDDAVRTQALEVRRETLELRRRSTRRFHGTGA